VLYQLSYISSKTFKPRQQRSPGDIFLLVAATLSLPQRLTKGALYQLSYISSKTFTELRSLATLGISAEGSRSAAPRSRLQSASTSARNFFVVLLVANLVGPKVQNCSYRKQSQHNQRQGPNTDLAIPNRQRDIFHRYPDQHG
jgi:hypothetical protein